MKKKLFVVFMKKNCRRKGKELKEKEKKEKKLKELKRKVNKLFVKWKGYDNSFNAWVDKKNLIT